MSLKVKYNIPGGCSLFREGRARRKGFRNLPWGKLGNGCRQRIDRCGNPASIKNPQEAIGPLMHKVADEKTK